MKIILDGLLDKISRILSMDVADLDPVQPLIAYGVDSLVSVELRSWLARKMQAELSVFDITSILSISQVAAMAMERSRLVGKD